MPGKILKVDYIAAAFSGRCEGCHSKRVNGHGGIQIQQSDIAFDKLLHRSPGKRAAKETVVPPTARRPGRRKKRGISFFVNLGFFKPNFNTLKCFWVKGHASFFPALPANF